MSTPSDIGIEGLPAPLGALPLGNLYALSAPDAALAEALTICATRAALAARRRIALVVRDPATTAAALSCAGIDVVRAHKRGGLRLFAWTANSARAARLGPAQLLDELDAFGCGSDTLVWLWPAHDALRWDEPAALAGFARLYHGWARLCRSSLVLLFGEQGAGEGYAQLLASHYPPLAGLALLHGDARDACWETRRWLGVDASATGALLRLQVADEGRLICPPDLSAEAERWRRRILEAADRDTVYIAAAAADGSEPNWTVLADAAEIEQRAAHAVGATCVFAISAPQELRPLAQRIHRLRIRSGRGVRLLVRECGFRLRHGQAQLLLALGANAIVSAEQATSEAVAAHNERPFARPLAADFETAMRSAIPPAIGGPRDPTAFAEQARALALRAEEAGLACALLSFRLGAGVSAAEVRARCRPTRSGDLFCTETDALHLFLYGCWPDDIDKALRHILTGALDTLFDSQVRNTEPALMLAALDSLAARTQHDAAVTTAAVTAPAHERLPRAVQAAPLQRSRSPA